MFDRVRSVQVSKFPAFRNSLRTVLLSVVLVSTLAAQTPGDEELIVRSLEYYRTGNCKDAEPLLEKVLLHQPKNIAVRKLLANCLLQDNKTDEARIQFQLVLDDAPQDAEAFQGLRASMTEIQKRELVKQTLAIESRAVTSEQFRSSHEFRDAEELIKRRRLGEAQKILEGIVNRHPDSVPARQRLAEIYSGTKRFDKAAETYRALAERPRASSAFLLRAAQNYAWNANYPEATTYYRRYLQRKPDDLKARMALSNVLMSTGHSSEAAGSYRLYLQKKPDDPEARITLANILMWSGRYREAIPEFERVQSQRPRDLKVQLALAQCYQQVAEKELALKAYEKVLELDPDNPVALEARASYSRYFDELPRQQAMAALEHNDFEGAARLFAEYLQKHPESTETLLRVARAYSWAQRFPEAGRYYEEYLLRVPIDSGVRREFARMEMWDQNYASARKHFEQLVRTPAATDEDYEALIHAYAWGGDLAGAQPYAEKLAALDPGNSLARQTLGDFAEQQKLSARSRAEELAAARRFPEAVEAYRRYMDRYGKDQQTELLICRLFSWGMDYDRAAEAFRGYLRQYPLDSEARFELANIENWSGQYRSAEADYEEVLRKEPKNVPALLALAQVADYRGDDPFKVRKSFQRVLSADPQNPLAQGRLAEIHPHVVPTLSYAQASFGDSDGFSRSVNTFEATFPLPGRIKVTPFYTFGYFHQLRLIRGTTQEFQTLNREIGERNGTILGNGGGARIEISPRSRWSWMGELGATHFDSSRSSLNGRAEVAVHAGHNRTLGLSYAHRDAIHELNTGASLAAGIMGDTILLSYQQPLGERLRFWTSGGITRYSRGTDSKFPGNTQRRVSARVDYQVGPSLSLGYSSRLSSFISSSPLYFSPSVYQTHGLAYGLNRHLSKTLRVAVEGEVNYGRIDRINTFELAMVPAMHWQVRRGWLLRAGYRLSRGRASSFGSPIYRTEGAEFGLSKVF